MRSIVKSIVLNAQTCKDQVLLREVINSSSFWQKASATEMGSKAFKALVGERIRNLSSKSKPVFRRGQGAYCTIVKTRRVFEDMEKQWQAWQGELARLKKSIHGISEECFEENAKGEQNAAMIAVVEERHLFEVKRLKTIPAGIEVIDLT